MEFIILLIIGAIVGWLADLVVPGEIPYGIIGTIIVGILGAYLGGFLLGGFGPDIPGTNVGIIPAVLGAIILAFAIRFVMSSMSSRR